ncbi:unnamed protein product [Closterium sp. NIES-54]
MVTTTTPGGQRVSICTCTRMGRHLATFTRRPGSSLSTLTAKPPQVAACPVRLQLRERFREDLPVLRQHSDRGGEFSSYLLRDFCRGEGILQSFTLSDSPQQNGIAERRIGLVMEVARTSMIHAVAPHFLWPFAVQYAAHQLNLWPRVSLPETSPTLRWTGEVGNASLFRVTGSRAFVRDTSADKLSARAIPCVFLGFPPGAPGWQFYHPTSRRVFPSKYVTFDESVPFYRLFPYRGTASGGAESGGAEPGGAESEGAGSGGAEPAGVEPGGAEPEGVELEGADSEGAEYGATGDTGAGGAGVTAGAGGTGGTAAASPGGARTRGTGAAGSGGVGGTGAGDPSEPGAAGAGGTGAGGIGAGGAGAGGAGAGGTGAGGAGAGGAGAGGAGAGGTGARGGAGGAGGVDPGAGGARGTGAGGTMRTRAYFVPLLQQVLGVPSYIGLTPPLLCPPPDQSQPPLQPASPLPAPSPYTEQTGGLTKQREPASRPVSLV